MLKQSATFLLFFVIAIVATTLPAHAQDELFTSPGRTNNVIGTLLAVETFDAVDAWERYTNPRGVELGVENGVYRAYTMSGGYVWGLNDQQHNDIILEVEATPLTINFSNGYGVMCRAEEDCDGYYFMINANGYFSIAKGEGDYIQPLVDWQSSDAIYQEIDRNIIRAGCVGDTLSMYANNQLLAEVTDTTYSTGFAGLSVAATSGSDVDIAFDNLAMYLPVTLN